MSEKIDDLLLKILFCKAITISGPRLRGQVLNLEIGGLLPI